MFHSKCDNAGATVSVMQLSTSRTIGGYWPGDWASTSDWGMHPESFLFSLTNSFKHTPLLNSSHVFDDSQYGPTFGEGHDLEVQTNLKSVFCNLGHTFKCRTGTSGSPACKHDFCGTDSESSILELEVFSRWLPSTTTTTSTTTVASKRGSLSGGWLDSRHSDLAAALGRNRMAPSRDPRPGDRYSRQRVNGAVAYLVRPVYEELRSLFNSLVHLNHNFCNQFQMREDYHVLIFMVDLCIDKLTKGLMQQACSCKLRFETVTKSFHEVPDSVNQYYKEGSTERDLYYGKRTRWYLQAIFEHEAVRDLDFIWRLEPSSSILSQMTFDPFYDMFAAQPRKRYAYYCSCFEAPEYRSMMHKFVAKYMQEQKVTSNWTNFNTDEIEPVAMPSNNIEIIDVKWWRSPEVQHFVNAVIESKGIWRHRWGDAAIRGMAISAFLREDELLHMQKFRYSYPWNRLLEPLAFEHADSSAEASARQDGTDGGRYDGNCTEWFHEEQHMDYRFSPDCTNPNDVKSPSDPGIGRSRSPADCLRQSFGADFTQHLKGLDSMVR